MKKILSFLVALVFLFPLLCNAQWPVGGWAPAGSSGTLNSNLTLSQSLGPNLAPAFSATPNYTVAGAFVEADNSMSINTTGGTNTFQPTAALTVTAGTIYRVDVTFGAYSSGTINISVGNSSAASIMPAASTTLTAYVAATDTANLVIFTGTAGAINFTITNVTCKVVGSSSGTLKAENADIYSGPIRFHTAHTNSSYRNNQFMFYTADRSTGTSVYGGGFGYSAGAGGLYVSNSSGTEMITLTGASIRMTGDTYLHREAASVFAIRNAGTYASPVPQELRIYNYYAASDKYERGFIKWSGSDLYVGTEKGSAEGSARALKLQTDATTRWAISGTAGVMYPATDNTYYIGYQNYRVPAVYLSGQIYGGGQTGGLAIAALATVTTGTVTPNTLGGGQTWSYRVVPVNLAGSFAGPGTNITTTDGATWANFSGAPATYKNTIAWSGVNGAYQYKIYRTAVPSLGSGGTIGTLIATLAGNYTSYDDVTTTALDGATPPTLNGTGAAYADRYNNYTSGSGLLFGLVGNLSAANRVAFQFASSTQQSTSGTNGLMSIYGTYNQTSGTATNYDLLINRTETAIGSGTQRMISAQLASVEKWGIDNRGIPQHSPADYAGSPVTPTNPLKFFGYNKSLADDASVTLPAVTTCGYGVVHVGGADPGSAGYPFTQFFVDGTGNVVLSGATTASDVSANADTDGDLCIGTADPQEPLIIKNRLGGTRVVNIMFWYD